MPDQVLSYQANRNRFFKPARDTDINSNEFYRRGRTLARKAKREDNPELANVAVGVLQRAASQGHEAACYLIRKLSERFGDNILINLNNELFAQAQRYFKHATQAISPDKQIVFTKRAEKFCLLVCEQASPALSNKAQLLYDKIKLHAQDVTLNYADKWLSRACHDGNDYPLFQKAIEAFEVLANQGNLMAYSKLKSLRWNIASQQHIKSQGDGYVSLDEVLDNVVTMASKVKFDEADYQALCFKKPEPTKTPSLGGRTQ